MKRLARELRSFGRCSSRHHQVDHGLEPNGQNGVRFLNWHSVLGLILS